MFKKNFSKTRPSAIENLEMIVLFLKIIYSHTASRLVPPIEKKIGAATTDYAPPLNNNDERATKYPMNTRLPFISTASIQTTHDLTDWSKTTHNYSFNIPSDN